MSKTNQVELPDLGRNVKRERLSRGWSLEDLAKICGVSKAMLSQVESGKVNPTIGTLWKIAAALEVDLNLLLQGKKEILKCFEVGRSNDLPLLHENQSGEVTIKVLSGKDLLGKLEFYHLTFAEKAELASDAHYPGSEEIITVVSGQVSVSVRERSTVLQCGDVLRFASDLPHCIKNCASGSSILHMIVRFPSENVQ